MEKTATIKTVKRIYSSLNETPASSGKICRVANVSYYSGKAALSFLLELGLIGAIKTSYGLLWFKPAEKQALRQEALA